MNRSENFLKKNAITSDYAESNTLCTAQNLFWYSTEFVSNATVANLMSKVKNSSVSGAELTCYIREEVESKFCECWLVRIYSIWDAVVPTSKIELVGHMLNWLFSLL